MTLSLYQASVPVLVRGLTQLIVILEKGEAHAVERKIDPAVLVSARLFPDMLPLARQVMIATDNAKGFPARIAGQEVPRYEDTETTFAELKARVEKTLAFVKSFEPGDIDGKEDKVITFKLGPNEVTFNGQDYLTGFLLPNFYFHVSMTYAILRHNGVVLGKRDYLGA
ncbi:MAG: DUF1993 domain-containing protein [Proteobacteria bacterium]|nr:DUF1993 domain-containing protein [Pseudomonadota bacterium]